jgi:hypothetical protein
VNCGAQQITPAEAEGMRIDKTLLTLGLAVDSLEDIDFGMKEIDEAVVLVKKAMDVLRGDEQHKKDAGGDLRGCAGKSA